MSLGPAGFRLSDVKRAVQQARDLGIVVEKLEITTKGGVKISMGPASIPEPDTNVVVTADKQAQAA